jgi:hypothetical protein
MSCISTCSQCIIRHDRMFIDLDLLRMQCDLKMEKMPNFLPKMAKIDAEQNDKIYTSVACTIKGLGS